VWFDRGDSRQYFWLPYGVGEDACLDQLEDGLKLLPELALSPINLLNGLLMPLGLGLGLATR
jgi:hypothetical protein